MDGRTGNYTRAELLCQQRSPVAKNQRSRGTHPRELRSSVICSDTGLLAAPPTPPEDQDQTGLIANLKSKVRRITHV